MHSGSRKSETEGTGEQLKCEVLSRVLENGYLVCNGMDINSTCWTRCIEGYEKENALTGSYICLENGEWEGEGTTCVRKDCGSLDQVIVSLSNENTYVLDVMNSNRKFDISLKEHCCLPQRIWMPYSWMPAIRICQVRALKERKYQLRLPFLMCGMSTFSLLNAPNEKIRSYLVRPNISTHSLSGLTAGAPNDNFRKNICSEDDLRSRIFETVVVKFLACLPLLGFSNPPKIV